MKPNFHAIGAIVYGLRFGITGLPTFLRRGWLGVLLSLGATVGMFSGLLEEAHMEALQGNMGPGIFAPADEFLQEIIDDWGDDQVVIEWGDEGEVPVEEFVLFALIQFVALILMVPGYVDAYRRSAGQEIDGAFFPTFGSAEWSLIFSFLLWLLATLLVLAAIGLPIFALLGLGIAAEQPVIAILAAPVAFFAGTWWMVRSSLIPVHSALVGRTAFMEGFGITGGRFWKLFGTVILMGVVFFLIDLATGILVLTAALQEAFDVTLIINGLVEIFFAVAGAGFAGRIAGELMGLVDETGTAPGDPRKPFAEEVDELVDDIASEVEDWSSDAVDAADDIPVDRGFRAETVAAAPVMMRRSDSARYAYGDETAPEERHAPEPTAPGRAERPSVQFVRRRFRG